MKKPYHFIMGAILLGFSGLACASSTGTNPWEKVLQDILDSLTGPVAYSVAGIAVFMTGLTLAFVDLQGGAKKGVQVALGISIAVGATSIVTSFFNVSGALV